jgi:hypothetical protein
MNKPIIMVKNWLNDSHLNCTTNSNFKDYVNFEVVLKKDNYEFIEEFEYFEELLIDID